MANYSNDKKELLGLIENYWSKNPEMRFLQLITNLSEEFASDLFYVDDNRLMRKLKEKLQ